MFPYIFSKTLSLPPFLLFALFTNTVNTVRGNSYPRYTYYIIPTQFEEYLRRGQSDLTMYSTPWLLILVLAAWDSRPSRAFIFPSLPQDVCNRHFSISNDTDLNKVRTRLLPLIHFLLHCCYIIILVRILLVFYLSYSLV